MTEIVKIYNTVKIGSEVVNAVNARDLHKALESGKDFSNWMKARIQKLDLIEGLDYVSISGNSLLAQMGEQPNKGRSGAGLNKIEYFVTIDIAKHLAMMESTDKGKEVRKYFIECEKELRKVQQHRLPQTYKEALAELLREVEEKEKLVAQIEEDKPKVEFANQVTDSNDCISIGDFAKILTDNKTIKIGRNKLFKWLRDNKYLMSDNMPYQQYIDLDYFRVIEQTYEINDEVKIGPKTLLTGKGQLYFTEKLKKSK